MCRYVYVFFHRLIYSSEFLLRVKAVWGGPQAEERFQASSFLKPLFSACLYIPSHKIAAKMSGVESRAGPGWASLLGVFYSVMSHGDAESTGGGVEYLRGDT